MHDVKSAWRKKKVVSLLTLDIEGYFNNVNHSRLISTLRHLGFSVNICNWLQPFLSNCTVQIRVDGVICDRAPLAAVGLPQGSPLSPVLSSIYTLPLLFLFRYSPGIIVRAYVDDFSILVFSNSYSSNIDLLKEAAHEAGSCLRDLGLRFELDKCELMHFAASRAHLAENPNLPLDRPNGGTHTVRAASSLCWLGFYLDRQLDFKDHVQKMAIKGCSVIAGLRLLANSIRGLSVYHAHLLFKTCVLPVLTYGSVIWFHGSRQKSLIRLIEHTQNAGIRWLLGAFHTSPVPAMEHVASIPPIHITLQRLSYNASTRLRCLPGKSEVAQHLPRGWDTHNPSAPLSAPLCKSQSKRSPIQHLASLSDSCAEFTLPYLIAPWEGPHPWNSRLKIRHPRSNASRDERKFYLEETRARIAALATNGSIVCYSDGSKRKINGHNQVGAGFAIEQAGREIDSGRIGLGRKAEVFDTEMLALAMGARKSCAAAVRSQCNSITFFSDNIAAVQRICDLSSHAGQFASIIFRKAIDDFLRADPSRRVDIPWIPGHSGIIGNDRADALVNQAVCRLSINLFSRSITWSKARATRRAARSWRIHWGNAHKSHYAVEHLRSPPSLKLSPFHKDPRVSRAVHCRLIQVILGHGFFGEYYAHFVPTEDIDCPCGEPVQTLRHVLYDCPLHNEARAPMYEVSGPLHPSRLFGTVPGLRAIASFLESSSAFRKR